MDENMKRSIEHPAMTQAAATSFILDLDGTLISGRRVLPGAREVVQQLEDRFVVVSNNSTHAPEELAVELAALGLRIPQDRILLAGIMALQVVAQEYGPAPVLIAGSAGLRREAMRRGFNLVEQDAEVVLLARDPHFNYQKLERLANEVRRGAQLIVTNGDLTHPGPDGQVIPETGSLLQAVLACAQTGSVRIIGKPEAALLLEALRRLEAAPEDCVLVGDNPKTDAAGAERLGMPYLLLGRSPESHLADLSELAQVLSRRGSSQFPWARRIA